MYGRVWSLAAALCLAFGAADLAAETTHTRSSGSIGELSIGTGHHGHLPAGTVSVATHWGNGFLFVILIELDAEPGGADSELKGNTVELNHRYRWTGHVVSKDRRHTVHWRGDVVNRQATSLTINDKTYKLDAGSLFLVVPRGGRLQTIQLYRDTTKLPNKSEAVYKLFNTPEVRRHLRRSGPKR